MSSINSLSQASITTSTTQQTSPSATELSFDKHHNSFPWILHHILECEVSVDLPLRIMFRFNAGEKLPSVRDAHRWWGHDRKGQLLIQFLSNLEGSATRVEDISQCDQFSRPASHEQYVGDRFMDFGSEYLWDVDFESEKPEKERSKSQGLPTKFIQQFCVNVFTKEYQEFDVDQSLPAIDFIRDFECTRRRVLQETTERLGITRHNWRDVLKDDVLAETWVKNAQEFELQIEEVYASLYMNLRIWTMIKVLQAKPFYKPNVLAMLNTLFPPNVRDLPNDRIDPKDLYKHRKTFYSYANAVETRGSHVIAVLIEQLITHEGKHSWAHTRLSLEDYFMFAGLIIKQTEQFYKVLKERHSEGALKLRGSSPRCPSPVFPDLGIKFQEFFDENNDALSGQLDDCAVENLQERYRAAENRPADSEVRSSQSKAKSYQSERQDAPGNLSLWRSTTPVDRPKEVYPILSRPGEVNLYEHMTSAHRPSLPGVRPPPRGISPEVWTQNEPTWMDGKFVTNIRPSSKQSRSLPNSAKLPSDNFEFLNRPYEVHTTAPPKIKKKTSLTSLLGRRKSSNAIKQGSSNDENGLGISLYPSSSTLNFSRADTPILGSSPNFSGTTRKLRKAQSFSSKASESQSTLGLKKVSSISSLFVKKQATDMTPKFQQANSYEVHVPDPSTRPLRPRRPSQYGLPTPPNSSSRPTTPKFPAMTSADSIVSPISPQEQVTPHLQLEDVKIPVGLRQTSGTQFAPPKKSLSERKLIPLREREVHNSTTKDWLAEVSRKAAAKEKEAAERGYSQIVQQKERLKEENKENARKLNDQKGDEMSDGPKSKVAKVLEPQTLKKNKSTEAAKPQFSPTFVPLQSLRSMFSWASVPEEQEGTTD